jgi:hypothetical protein
MTNPMRVLLAALLALVVVLPAWGGEGEGGENAGGTGVWILPRSTVLTSSSAQIGPGTQPRVPPLTLTSFASSAKLQVSNECSSVVATLFAGTAMPMDLPVLGQTVTLPASVVQGLAETSVTQATLVLVDASGKGYVLRLVIDLAAGTGQLLLY